MTADGYYDDSEEESEHEEPGSLPTLEEASSSEDGRAFLEEKKKLGGELPLSSSPSSSSGSSSPRRLPLPSSPHQLLVPVHIPSGEDESDNEVERSKWLRIDALLNDDSDHAPDSPRPRKRRRDDSPIVSTELSDHQPLRAFAQSSLAEADDYTSCGGEGNDASEEDEVKRSQCEWTEEARPDKRAKVVRDQEAGDGAGYEGRWRPEGSFP